MLNFHKLNRYSMIKCKCKLLGDKQHVLVHPLLVCLCHSNDYFFYNINGKFLTVLPLQLIFSFSFVAPLGKITNIDILSADCMERIIIRTCKMYLHWPETLWLGQSICMYSCIYYCTFQYTFCKVNIEG